MNRHFYLLLFLFMGLCSSLKAQSYKLTHFKLTLTSTPQAYDGPTLVIGDTFLRNISIVKKGDSMETVIVKEKIIKRKKESFIKTLVSGGANNYFIDPSSNKTEKQEGIFDITVLSALNNGTRTEVYFKAKKISATP